MCAVGKLVVVVNGKKYVYGKEPKAVKKGKK